MWVCDISPSIQAAHSTSPPPLPPQPSQPLLSYPLRKVLAVVARPELSQIAFITPRDATSTSDHHRNTTTSSNEMPPPGTPLPTPPSQHPQHSRRMVYRKQCHAFRTPTPFEAGEIQAVLAAAFERAVRSPVGSQVVVIPSPQQPQTTTNRKERSRALSATPSRSAHHLQPARTSQSGGRHWLGKGLKQVDSMSVFQRLLLRYQSSPSSSRLGKTQAESPTPLHATPVRFRRQTPLPKCQSSATPKSSRPPHPSRLFHTEGPPGSAKKRRPLSAVFSGGFLQRLSFASMTGFGSASVSNTRARGTTPKQRRHQGAADTKEEDHAEVGETVYSYTHTIKGPLETHTSPVAVQLTPLPVLTGAGWGGTRLVGFPTIF